MTDSILAARNRAYSALAAFHGVLLHHGRTEAAAHVLSGFDALHAARTEVLREATPEFRGEWTLRGDA